MRYADGREKWREGLTGSEENDGLETGVFGSVDVQSLQLLHLFLEDADVVHEGDDAVGGHGRGVQAGSGEEGSDVQGHRTLGCIEDEEFAPHEAQEDDLVGHLQVREEGDVTRPFDGTEQQPRRQFADRVDAHDVV